MIIDIDNEYEIEYDLVKLFNDVSDKIVEVDGITGPLLDAQISVTICDNDKIKALNKEYRDIDKPTDVLSFPMYDLVPGEPFDSDFDEIILGDIVISLEKAKEQAKEYGHSLYRELAFLFTHGHLHLLGYDHIEDEDREVMENKQKEILDTLGIDR